ncbi:MAG: divalent-cation tolerance protein CutA [Nitrospinae bacterium]|nr:divalent-cation tolerance protein CutA [Nitrospinota bacterium]
MSPSNPIVVLVTASGEEEAAKIAGELVSRRLAACVNIIPGARSIYRWEGKICDGREALMIVKTTADKFTRLSETVAELHSYSTPEVIAMPVTAGSEKYLGWVFDSVKSA